MPIVRNQSSSVHDWIFTEQFNPVTDPKDGKAIRNKDYKLIAFDNGHQEFYHLATDTLEETDLLLYTLTNTDSSNYNYLCNELAALIGTSSCAAITGINEPEIESTLMLYPNPATNQLSINSSIPIEQVRIYNTTGQLVLQTKQIVNNAVDVSHLSKGVYITEITLKSPSRKTREELTAPIMRKWAKM